jgi:hypothetical protein
VSCLTVSARGVRRGPFANFRAWMLRSPVVRPHAPAHVPAAIQLCLDIAKPGLGLLVEALERHGLRAQLSFPLGQCADPVQQLRVVHRQPVPAARLRADPRITAKTGAMVQCAAGPYLRTPSPQTFRSTAAPLSTGTPVLGPFVVRRGDPLSR